MREARIAVRTINAVWAGEEVVDVDLKRMNAAAELIVRRKGKRGEEETAVVAWLQAKRDEMGLTALAKMLGVDAANLEKMIEDKRGLAKALAAVKVYMKTQI